MLRTLLLPAAVGLVAGMLGAVLVIGLLPLWGPQLVPSAPSSVAAPKPVYSQPGYQTAPAPSTGDFWRQWEQRRQQEEIRQQLDDLRRRQEQQEFCQNFPQSFGC